MENSGGAADSEDDTCGRRLETGVTTEDDADAKIGVDKMLPGDEVLNEIVRDVERVTEVDVAACSRDDKVGGGDEGVEDAESAVVSVGVGCLDVGEGPSRDERTADEDCEKLIVESAGTTEDDRSATNELEARSVWSADEIVEKVIEDDGNGMGLRV